MAQLLLPELIEAIKLVPMAPNTFEVRRQMALAIHTTCATFGAEVICGLGLGLRLSCNLLLNSFATARSPLLMLPFII